jgi:hypothetical protein
MTAWPKEYCTGIPFVPVGCQSNEKLLLFVHKLH